MLGPNDEEALPFILEAGAATGADSVTATGAIVRTGLSGCRGQGKVVESEDGNDDVEEETKGWEKGQLQ